MSYLWKYQSRFYPLERVLVDKVIDSAPECYQGNLRSQIDCINSICRLADFKEVNLYRLRKGKPTFEQSISLPFSGTEHVICSILFTFPDLKGSIKVKAWLVEGFLFSLTFDKSPKDFKRRKNVIIKEIHSNYEGLNKQVAQEFAQNVKYELKMIAGLLGDYHYARLKKPLSVQEKKRLLDGLATKLPDDYLQLILFADGFEVEDGIVYGLKTIRQVVTDNMNYLILAEHQNGFIAVSEGSGQGNIYYYATEDDDVVVMGRSFIPVLKQKIL